MTSTFPDSSLANLPEKVNLAEAAEGFVFPTSFAQQRLWFLDRLAPGNPFYNVTTALRFIGLLNVTALEKTFTEIVRRHESLRTLFTVIDDRPVQVILAPFNLPIKKVDLRQLPVSDREASIQRLSRLEAESPFDLSVAPLLRVTILQLADDESILLLNMHHIVSDDWSIGVLIRELGTIYTAFVNDLPSPLPELPLQYADFSEWQREWLQGQILEPQFAYWRQQLQGISHLNLPTDRPKPAFPSYRGATQFLELPKQLSDALKILSQQEGTTLFMTLLAAFQTLLYRYTGQEDIGVGTAIANRNRSEIEGLIGFFVNSLVLRTDLSGNPTFQDLLHRVREVTLGAYAHQDLPFEKLVEALQPERSLNRHPFFQVVFGLQNAPMEELDLPNLKLSSLKLETQTTRFDLELHLWDATNSFRNLYGEDWKYTDSLRGVIVYNTDLFDATSIAQLLENFITLLASIVTNPERRIDQLPLLGKTEQDRLLEVWNHTETCYPKQACIHQLFEEQVKQNGNAIAVTFDNQEITYQDLNECSNQLGHYLQKLGVGTESLVAMSLPRSIDTIVAMLGILKAGGAYLPLDPTYPRDRLNFMLADSQASILLTQESLSEVFSNFDRTLVCLDRDRSLIELESEENCINTTTADCLAYIIYTSGSTGHPKGVAVPHQAVNRLILNTNYIQLDSTDKVAQVSNTSFDAATFEIWGALLNGAKLIGLSTNLTLSPHDLALEIRQKGITTLFLTTALFQQTAREIPHAFQSLRYFLFGGEIADSRWVTKVLKSGKPQELLHVYGPTENTTFTSYYRVQDVPEGAISIPIGKPISNTQVYLLDSHLQPVPIGIPGEIYIGGEGLARGYLNRPDLTTDRFIPHPFSAEKGAKLYKTGDLARYRRDGNLEFLGRIDDQVKIRGFRIELGEIEVVLSQHELVQDAVVIVQEEIPGERNLIAYIVPANVDRSLEVTPLLQEIRQYLKEKLPNYMMPSSYSVLESFPLTPNGKINRHALPKIDTENEELLENQIAPRTSVEEVLVKIWATVLGKQQVSIYDNFFEIGGHSLLATQLLSRIRDALQIELSVSNLFESPTVASLANYIETVGWIAQEKTLDRPNEDTREEVEF